MKPQVLFFLNYHVAANPWRHKALRLAGFLWLLYVNVSILFLASRFDDPQFPSLLRLLSILCSLCILILFVLDLRYWSIRQFLGFRIFVALLSSPFVVIGTFYVVKELVRSSHHLRKVLDFHGIVLVCWLSSFWIFFFQLCFEAYGAFLSRNQSSKEAEQVSGKGDITDITQ